MKAAWWWIDRWRASSAYTSMTAEERGVYREFLDELWLRDGLLPLDEMQLARLAGGESVFARVKDRVLSHFVLTPEGWRNPTHDEVQCESKAKARKQQNYRDRLKNGLDVGVRGQDGKCDCCGSPFPAPWKKTVIQDHCHTADKNRGLVCASCNTIIGRLECGRSLRPESTLIAQTYVDKWKERFRNVPSSPSPSPSIRQLETIREAAYRTGEPPMPNPTPVPEWEAQAKAVWLMHLGGENDYIYADLIPVVRRVGPAKTLIAWEAYCKAQAKNQGGKFASARAFAAKPGPWIQKEPEKVVYMTTERLLASQR